MQLFVVGVLISVLIAVVRKITVGLKKEAVQANVQAIKLAKLKDAPALLGYQPTYQSYLEDRRKRDRIKQGLPAPSQPTEPSPEVDPDSGLQMRTIYTGRLGQRKTGTSAVADAVPRTPITAIPEITIATETQTETAPTAAVGQTPPAAAKLRTKERRAPVTAPAQKNNGLAPVHRPGNRWLSIKNGGRH